MTKYTIYKITNQINGKFYIGKHKCNHNVCHYYGSGIHIRKAIKKYGKENFVKEILVECSSAEEMNVLEQQLITEEIISSDESYNLSIGGKGGWDYVNRAGKGNTPDARKKKSQTMKKYWTEEQRTRQSDALKKYCQENGTQRHTDYMNERYADPVYKEKFIETMSKVNKDPEKRRLASEKLKLKWQDPEYLAKMKARKPRGPKNATNKS